MLYTNKEKLRLHALPLKVLESTNRFLPLDTSVTKKPIKAIGKWKTNHSNGFTIDECLEFPETEAIGVILGKNLICIDFDGESAIEYACEIGIDITGQTWQVKRDSHKGFWRYKYFYRPTPAQIEQIPFGFKKANHHTKDAIKEDGKVIKKGEALEVFADYPCYAVVAGKHPSGDNYVSHDEYTVNDITAPPAAVWDWVLHMASLQPKVEKTKKSLTTKDGWERLIKCPICGRDQYAQPICTMSKDRDTISCFIGNTYYPPKGLKAGELVVGGTWAYSKNQYRDSIGEFSIFVRHKPTTMKAIRQSLMEKANAK